MPIYFELPIYFERSGSPLLDFSNTDNLGTAALNTLNLRGHLGRRNDVLIDADAARPIEFGTRGFDFEALLGDRPRLVFGRGDFVGAVSGDSVYELRVGNGAADLSRTAIDGKVAVITTCLRPTSLFSL